jgi:uncharacterized repeat protein (TIGR03803 family)
LAAFDGGNGNGPGGLIIDGGGNLYGATSRGGATGVGTIFDIAHNSKTITTLTSFDAANSSHQDSLLRDSDGNLFGVTSTGGANGTGSVFELASGSMAISTLASFDAASGTGPSGLTVDAGGNIYGTTPAGGASGDGTVFELAHGSAMITTLASFDGSNGSSPSYGGVVIDSNGNLYGTTVAGGGSDEGTVFEIVRGSGTVTTLASFTGTNGSNPYAGVVVDGSGNLYGSVGSLEHIPEDEVFESPHGSGGITILAKSYSTPGQPPFFGPVTLDGNGNLYGTTAGIGNAGTIFELARDLPPPPTVSSFTVNDGSIRRSMVTSLTVRFGMPVVLGSQALTLTTQAGAPVPFNLNTIDNQAWNLTFTGSQLPGGSLNDGHYVLVVHASQVTGTDGQPMAADQNYSFFRLFGDISGDGTVNSADYFQFKRAFGSSGDPSLLAAFDYNGDGVVNSADYFQFKKRFGMRI